MTVGEEILFYVGALMYLDLDSDEVDEILSAEDLAVESNSLAECMKCIRRCFPERYSFGQMVKPY